MGINTLTNASNDQVILRAGANVSINDLIISTDDGYAYPASNNMTVSQLNKGNTGPVAVMAPYGLPGGTTFEGTTYTVYPWQGASVELGENANDFFALAYVGNGTTATTGLNIIFRSYQANTNASANVIVSNDATITSTKLRKADSSNIFIGYTNSTVKAIRYIVMKNDGTVLKAAANVSACPGTPTATSYDFATLKDNKVAFAYGNNSGNGNVAYQIYDSGGSNVTSEIVIDTAASGVNPVSVKVLPLSSGNFVIAYQRDVATAAYKFGIYSSSGTEVSAVKTIRTGSSINVTPNQFNNSAIELKNGNIVFQTVGTVNFLHVYDSSGNLIRNIRLPDSIASTQGSMCATDAGFAYLTSAFFATYDFNGNSITAIAPASSTILGNSGISSYNNSVLYFNGAAGFTAMVYTQSIGCGAQATVYLQSFDEFARAIGSQVVIQNGAGTMYGYNTFMTAKEKNIFTSFVFSRYFVSLYDVRRRSIIGVSQETVPAETNFRVGTKGTFTFNERIPIGGTFDQRANTVVGAKGLVTGNVAVLYGIT